MQKTQQGFIKDTRQISEENKDGDLDSTSNRKKHIVLANLDSSVTRFSW